MEMAFSCGSDLSWSEAIGAWHESRKFPAETTSLQLEHQWESQLLED
jgi:hypothetical protein